MKKKTIIDQKKKLFQPTLTKMFQLLELVSATTTCTGVKQFSSLSFKVKKYNKFPVNGQPLPPF